MAGVAGFLDALREANSNAEGEEIAHDEAEDVQVDDDTPHHYTHRSELPQAIQKYWQQRNRIFSKYDEGIWMTNNDWFGVTPEPVANQIAAHLAQAAPPEKTVLIDAFGGAGGNTIAFALSNRWKQIFYIEKNPNTLKCAKHNAEIYGVKNRIVFIQGDCFDILVKRFKGQGNKAVIFASPPWGGPTYKGEQIFDVETMEPYSLERLVNGFRKVSSEIAMYLPRSSNLNQIAKYVTGDDNISAVHYCVDGASKALCVYYGRFLRINEEK